MSYYAQRYLPILIAGTLGIVSGSYIFDPILKQYKVDTNGSFQPEQLPFQPNPTNSNPTLSESIKDAVTPIKTNESEHLSQNRGGVGSTGLSGLTHAAEASDTQQRAEHLRELAVKNASARAVESAKRRKEVEPSIGETLKAKVEEAVDGIEAAKK